MCDFFSHSRLIYTTYRLFCFISTITLIACYEPLPELPHKEESWPVVGEDRLIPAEHLYRQRLETATQRFSGRVVTQDGQPIAMARVTIGDWTSQTNEQGDWVSADIPFQNYTVVVEHPDFRAQVLSTYHNQPFRTDVVDIGLIHMDRKISGKARLLFTGDLMLGRRYFEKMPSVRDQFPQDDPEALIKASNPLPDSRAVLKDMIPLFSATDLNITNLESVVTNDPSTPHEAKDFAYFTLPESLEALHDLNIHYVALGNNHTFDYLDQGTLDTIAAVEDAGFAWSGVGLDNISAWKPAILQHKDLRFGILSATSIAGEKHDISYVANADKGGAADLREFDRMEAHTKAMIEEGIIPIPLPHTGTEYARGPGSFQISTFDKAVSYGAAVVVAHHPHAPQGFGMTNGIPIAHSLGNFVFDSQRHETFVGLLFQIDVGVDGWENATGIPMYIENYIPRMLTGETLDNHLRRLVYYSRGYGATVIPDGRVVHIYKQDAPEVDEWVEQTHQIELKATVTDDNYLYFDTRGIRPINSWLSNIEGNCQAAHLGVDIMIYGDFEDIDTDGDILEQAHWYHSPTNVFPCSYKTHRGHGALCMVMTPRQNSQTVSAFRPRVRAYAFTEEAPNLDVSFLGYASGELESLVQLKIDLLAAEENRQFGQRNAASWRTAQLPFGKDNAFAPFVYTADLPFVKGANIRFDDLRAFRVTFRGDPALQHNTYFIIDDMAIVTWMSEQAEDIMRGGPHDRDFIRCDAGSDETLSLTFTNLVRS